MRTIVPFFAVLTACGGTIDLDVEDADDVRDLCESEAPSAETVTISFSASPPGCPWEEGDNLAMGQGIVSARVEQTQTLGIPEDSVVCGLDFEFQPDPQVEPVMEYDDHMFFLFNDIVLASSNADLVDLFPRDDGLPAYQWRAIAGEPFAFDGAPTYCLGQEDGEGDCVVPDPETRASLILRYDQRIIDELAVRSRRAGETTFGFVVMGDNDPDLDCRHEAFTFQVDVPYVTR